MIACPKKIETYMHDFLDGDLSPLREKKLRQHLSNCVDCQHHMDELNRFESLLRAQNRLSVETPQEFTQRVMNRIKQTKTSYKNSVGTRKYRLLVPAILLTLIACVLVMPEILRSHHFSVSNTSKLLVDHSTVTVPQNTTINHDIVVENGDLIVKGKIAGDVTIVNGQIMTSAEGISGQINTIDDTFEVLWYSVKNEAKKIISID